jgi:hypothetical protein
MAEIPFEEPPAQWRVVLTLLVCVLLAGFLQIACEKASDNFVLRALGDDPLALSLLKLIFAFLLCLFTFQSSGLTFGGKAGWRRHWLAVFFFFVLPLVLCAILYPLLGGKPAPGHGKLLAFWLVTPVAEQLLFSGFIYGQMQAVFGKPSQAVAGAFSAAPIVTAFLFALYFWPELRNANESGSALLHMILAFIYSAWILNLRRWTASVWLCVLNHVLMNVLMALL